MDVKRVEIDPKTLVIDVKSAGTPENPLAKTPPKINRKVRRGYHIGRLIVRMRGINEQAVAPCGCEITSRGGQNLPERIRFHYGQRPSCRRRVQRLNGG